MGFPAEKRVRNLYLLVGCNSLCPASRLADISTNTITKPAFDGTPGFIEKATTKAIQLFLSDNSLSANGSFAPGCETYAALRLALEHLACRKASPHTNGRRFSDSKY